MLRKQKKAPPKQQQQQQLGCSICERTPTFMNLNIDASINLSNFTECLNHNHPHNKEDFGYNLHHFCTGSLPKYPPTFEEGIGSCS